ncbi:MAG: hypothetical protein M1837_002706 [Sclerophora amabilis]|nr:MAG: hypothetical protein M1837_002706 [Sclerophora amabilis]
MHTAGYRAVGAAELKCARSFPQWKTISRFVDRRQSNGASTIGSFRPFRLVPGAKHRNTWLRQKPEASRSLEYIKHAPIRSRSGSSTSCTTTAAKFSYRVAAAYSGKGRRFNPESNSFNFSPPDGINPTATDQNPRRRSKSGRPDSGQDAFFISRLGETGGVAFGVADGVGGWLDSGIDSAHFSHGLCEQMAKAAYEFQGRADTSVLQAHELLMAGYKNVLEDKTIPGGGSTACVAVARNDGNVNVANLGDSGFAQLRLNAVHFYSDPQTHAFNTPYQLSIVPPKILAQAKMFGGSPSHDLPKDADNINRRVRHGDILVFATDGVWDNLSAQDILRIASSYMTELRAWEPSEDGIIVGDRLSKLAQRVETSSNRPQGVTLQSILATAIAGKAKMASLDTKIDGPFAKEVHRYFPLDNYHGGKVDDICVVVAIVLEGS